MSVFLNYQLRIAQKEAAYNQYNYAGSALELSKIKERLAEIESQHAPLCKLKESNRDEAFAVAFYCVIGRFPDGYEYFRDKP